MKHLENRFFSQYQHGFRSKLSCITQLCEFSNDIFISYDESLKLDSMYLNFENAFDTIPHVLLLHKMAVLGLPASVIQWVQDYLSKRTQCVVVNRTSSSAVDVTSGVPQGSVLGPLLFKIYINDLTEEISSHIRLYSGDCVIYRCICNSVDVGILQSDLSYAASWCDMWKMRLNIKSSYVEFT